MSPRPGGRQKGVGCGGGYGMTGEEFATGGEKGMLLMAEARRVGSLRLLLEGFSGVPFGGDDEDSLSGAEGSYSLVRNPTLLCFFRMGCVRLLLWPRRQVGKSDGMGGAVLSGWCVELCSAVREALL